MLHQIVDLLDVPQNLGSVAQRHVRGHGVGQRPGTAVRLERDAGGQSGGDLVEVGEAESLSDDLLGSPAVAGLPQRPSPAVDEQADRPDVLRNALDGRSGAGVRLTVPAGVIQAEGQRAARPEFGIQVADLAAEVPGLVPYASASAKSPVFTAM
ncbi:hypothetical protein ACSCBZ_04695 [Streptomyces niveiscabiei]|uniref:hypothetical protein n=1 Tax=Streptomyces TaxID=1883 RepID=UPI00131DCE79|nr:MULTISPECIES: hypothetical protein [Streptomyces]